MQEVSIEQLVSARRAGAPVVDVRETEEYVEGHVPGAIHIPMGQLGTRLDEVPAAEEVYVICRSGVRSLKSAQLLADHGVTAYSVAGGTLGWIEAGQPVATGRAG